MRYQDLFRLDGRLALVTGASSGIGAATARMLAEAGARVLAGYNRGAARAADIVAALPGAGHRAVHISLEDSATSRAVADEVARETGRLDILVNSAGFTQAVAHADLDALDDALFERV
ncbi:MAG TPA: SDR family oxidoreductase, partial [Sphingomonadaceae bacterium]|nr:SDR family oxidoreductase [Sphingomonadaceae bacterium]